MMQANLLSANWRQREAAAFALGASVEGPSPDAVTPLVVAAMPALLGHMQVKLGPSPFCPRWGMRGSAGVPRFGSAELRVPPAAATQLHTLCPSLSTLFLHNLSRSIVCEKPKQCETSQEGYRMVSIPVMCGAAARLH